MYMTRVCVWMSFKYDQRERERWHWVCARGASLSCVASDYHPPPPSLSTFFVPSSSFSLKSFDVHQL